MTGGRRREAGFTLLEALAATAMLGLLAITVVPLVQGVGSADHRWRLQAQALLENPPADLELRPGLARSVPGHPAWSLICQELDPGPEPEPPPGSPPAAAPAHRWLLVVIRANDSGETLAESLVVIIDDGGLR